MIRNASYFYFTNVLIYLDKNHLFFYFLGDTCVPGSLFPNPHDCESYLQCDNGKFVTRKCGQGLYFSRNHKNDCVPPSIAGCNVQNMDQTR